MEVRSWLQSVSPWNMAKRSIFQFGSIAVAFSPEQASLAGLIREFFRFGLMRI
jgi:hypothetical protein